MEAPVAVEEDGEAAGVGVGEVADAGVGGVGPWMGSVAVRRWRWRVRLINGGFSNRCSLGRLRGSIGLWWLGCGIRG